MRTESRRAIVVALLGTIFAGGCDRVPEALSSKTPEQLKQLSEVTDRVVSLARSFAEDADPSSRREAIRQTIAAVAAAEAQYQWHSDAILNTANAETLGCIDAHAIDILELETLMAKLDAATQGQDEAKATDHKALLQRMAMDASRCAAQSAQLLVASEQRQEALEHASVLISGIYAIAATTRVASGLSLGPLLESQIRTYEAIVAKLGPKHEVPVVTDALPKLRATVAMLEKSGSARAQLTEPH